MLAHTTLRLHLRLPLRLRSGQVLCEYKLHLLYLYKISYLPVKENLWVIALECVFDKIVDKGEKGKEISLIWSSFASLWETCLRKCSKVYLWNLTERSGAPLTRQRPFHSGVMGQEGRLEWMKKIEFVTT